MNVFGTTRRACLRLAAAAILGLGVGARADEISSHIVISTVNATGTDDIQVMSSSGFAAALKELCAAYQQKTGAKVQIILGPSMGDTPQAVPNRLARGEPVDVVVIVKEALDKLATAGKIVPASRTDLAESTIGMAVRAGTPKPDISTLDAFKQTLRAAKAIAVSDSASGVYLSTVLFPKLDPTGAISAKTRTIPAKPVGVVVAEGAADLGFQQMSELKPLKGIDIVGPIPTEVQKVTMFSAGLGAHAANAAGGAALIKFLASPEARAAIERSGMEPASHN